MTLRLWIVYVILQFVGKFCSGLFITECPNQKATVSEGTNVTLTCGNYSVDIKWTNEEGSGTVIGQCNKTTCKTPDNLPLTLQAQERGSTEYDSVLRITNISSEQTFNLKCRSDHSDENAKCQLHVLKPPRYDPTSCKVWLSNWRVHGECTVDWMSASGVDYECYWSVNNEKEFGGFKGTPSYYTLHSVNYSQRVCSFNRGMESNEATYTYSMHVSGLTDRFSENITVEHPGEPTHNCLKIVREGSFVNCRCNSSKAGNPPAETMWDGVMNKTLHIKNIQRQDKTKAYTCRLMWGSDGQINRYTLYTFEIAYGPSSVRIDKIIDETGNEIKMLRLICTAVDVYPSAIFRWNITCDNQTETSNTSTCTVSTANVSQEAAVTCRAINNIFPDMSSLSSLVVDATGGKSLRQKKLSPSGKIFYIIVPILILVIIAAAIFVYWRKANMSKRQEASPPDPEDDYQDRENFLVEESAPEGDTTLSYESGTMPKREKAEKDAKSSYDTLQSIRLTEWDEHGEKSAPERCAAPSGDLYTRASKGNDHQNSKKCDQMNSTVEAVKEGSASNFAQDERDMLGLYANEFKKTGPKRYTGVLGDLYTCADKEKKEGDAKYCQRPAEQTRSAGDESDIQLAFESCVAPSRGLYVNVSKTCNRLENENVGTRSLRLESANEDMNVPTTSNAMETTDKSDKSVIDSSMYPPPLSNQDHQDDTYAHLMAR